jgi:hypothetical protein
MLAGDEADRMRAAYRKQPDRRVEKLAAAADKRGPWSVTFERPSGDLVKAGPNDYYSEGPYWWPDPKNPTGPYIRRDGERNPDRFQANRKALGDMSEAVLTLGMAAYLGSWSAAAARAATVLNMWFVDPKTRMNPHLEFGQAVRGHNTGRGTGIIDTVSLIHCAQGVALLEAGGFLDRRLLDGVRKWYAAYLEWMTTSAKGVDEKNARNNHGTWWTAQVAAFATLIGADGAKRTAWEQFRKQLVPREIEADGSCPLEEERTRSLSYSSMNLDGFAVLCRFGDRDNAGLWRFKTPKDVGVDNAFQYLLPYIVSPDKWKKQQIEPFEQDRVVWPGLAAVSLGSPEYLAGYRKLPRAVTPWVVFVDLLVAQSAIAGVRTGLITGSTESRNRIVPSHSAPR